MKKVIAAAAGLMLAGTMASAAVAAEPGIKFQGDARARYYFQEEYKSSDSSDTHWNSRVRLQWKATSKGGAYAIGRFRLGDATWDGAQQTGAGGESTNLKVDKAYIGVPFGPVTVEAGLMYRSLTTFTQWDVLVDSLQAKYIGDATIVLAFYEKIDEYVEDEDGNVAAEDAINDDDADRYGIWLNQKFTEGWGLTAALAVVDNSQTEVEGFLATAMVDGAFAGMTMAAELAYKEADLQATPDDGLGGWASLTIPVGPASVSGYLGFTADGFVADGDFGPFIMLSDVSQIATGIGIGQGGDTFFGALTTSFKATERLSLGAEIAYADIDNDDDASDEKAFEIGATASYAVTDGASLNGVIGYLDYDTAEYNPFGFGLSLEISY